MSTAFNNPIPRQTLPSSRESSRLTSWRESQSIYHAWKRVGAANYRASNLTGELSQLQRQIARVQPPRNALGQFHPFKIYQFPSFMRHFHPDDEWRRCKVRFGGILINPHYNPSTLAWGGGGNIPWGCDDAGVYPLMSGQPAGSSLNDMCPTDEIFTNPNEVPPDDNTAISPGWHEIVVPDDGKKYFVWISLCSAAISGLGPGSVCYGTSPTGCTEMYSGTTVNDPWPTWDYPNPPIEDPYHYWIGTVWVQNGELRIFQNRFDNIYAPLRPKQTLVGYGPGVPIRIRGEYNASLTYWIGDQVCVTGTDFTQVYVLYPKNAGDGGLYDPSLGPVLGVDPATNHPEPWLMVANFPNVITENWATGPFDGSKSFLAKT